MSLYSRDDANHLVDFYSEKMIGKQLVPGSPTKVEHLRLAGRTGNVFEVYAVGSLISAGLYPKRKIDLVARDLGLPAPDEILLAQFAK